MTLISQDQFKTDGYLGPFRLCNEQRAAWLVEERHVPSSWYTWYKSTFEGSTLLADVGSSKSIIRTLKKIIGDNLLLWATHFIAQEPSNSHGWHLDVEFGRMEGCTLWLGLKNLNERTTVSIITHSHLLNLTPQQLAKDYGIHLEDDEAMLKAAKKLDPRCELKTFKLKAGEYIIWSGRVWHTTLNKSDRVRHSVIFQYCDPSFVPKIPLNYEYPNTAWSDQNAPCLLIAGKDPNKLNLILHRNIFQSLSYHLKLFKFLLKNNGKRFLLHYLRTFFRQKLYFKVWA